MYRYRYIPVYVSGLCIISPTALHPSPSPPLHTHTLDQACLRLQRRYDEEYSALWATGDDMEARFQVVPLTD